VAAVRYPRAAVGGAVGPDERALALDPAAAELPLESGPRRPREPALPGRLPPPPLALVHAPVGPHVLALAVRRAAVESAAVDVAVGQRLLHHAVRRALAGCGDHRRSYPPHPDPHARHIAQIGGGLGFAIYAPSSPLLPQAFGLPPFQLRILFFSRAHASLLATWSFDLVAVLAYWYSLAIVVWRQEWGGGRERMQQDGCAFYPYCPPGIGEIDVPTGRSPPRGLREITKCPLGSG
jgi:hypothetical protein